MNLPSAGKIRNYIFMVVLCATIISLFTVLSIGADQDKAYRLNYIQYQQALNLVNQHQYNEAQKILAQLDKSSLASYQVMYAQAVCSMNTGDFVSAADFMQKARETRPAFLKDGDYLELYGIILYRLGEYDKAKLYLLESKKYNDNPERSKEAEKYLNLMATGTGGMK